MKIKTLIIVFVMCAFVFPQAALAQKSSGKSASKGLGMPRGAWWQREDVVKELKLSSSQQKEIEAVALENRKQMIKLRAELELAEVDLDPLLSAKKLDEKAITNAIDNVEAVRSKISRNRMQMLLSIRKIISRDQYLKLKSLKGIKRGKSGRQRGMNRSGAGRGQGLRSRLQGVGEPLAAH